MKRKEMERRDFLRTLAAGVPILALNWDAFPRGDSAKSASNEWDALIIGAGLGGLSCAAAFARQGFRPLVLEQHAVPGGYATTFQRPGGFVFDASLHSTTVGERNGVYNLIAGFPEITEVEFVPHPSLYRAIFPEHDLRVPQRDPAGYAAELKRLFPEEAAAIDNLLAAMKGLAEDVEKYSAVEGKANMMNFPQEFPNLFQAFSRTWGQFMDLYVANPKLRAVVTVLWEYFGLPPSKLAALYYALPAWGYLTAGGYYPKGKSQAISNALVRFIESKGGKVLLHTRVEKILTADHAVTAVRTADGREYKGRVVVANANVPDVFRKMLDEGEFLKEYLARLDTFSPSFSSFQVFLGLNRDLVGGLGIRDSEIFYATGYDPEADYRASQAADVGKGSVGITLYDNIYAGYSPKGKNTLTLIALQGYDHWLPYEADYFKGEKAAYRQEKERLADIIIDRIEKALLPGLRKAIAVKEIATPLTNVRYTRNWRGAIYGWDQTLDNALPRRLGQRTPIKNLFLAGAWTTPGGGYGAVIPSGLQCFAEIMKDWSQK